MGITSLFSRICRVLSTLFRCKGVIEEGRRKKKEGDFEMGF
jgi:hypothetical protein